ncbi:MAG: thiamine diphosphokinase, partial [Desulfobacula sp.]|nr:thiamine diphosphokinase [Desulfobacula sp.]
MSMKCVIIASGDLDYTEQVIRLIRNAELIICADGGAGHLKKLGILPHVLIGDFDSITLEDKLFFIEKQVKVISFPPEKDKTDSALCVDYALEQKVTDITLLGMTGTRLDHTLANIFLLKQICLKNIPARIINTTNQIYMVT